jgi:ATP-dependent helicase/nuclease subunit A
MITEEPWRRGRGGNSLGRAVHAVLQTIDLATAAGLEDASCAQATAEGLPHREAEVARLVRAACNSDIVRRAVASGRLWKEVPVVMPLKDKLLEGFIDLLFEEDGHLVVVDYKTDVLDAEETQEAAMRYRLQSGGYALALKTATGKPVKEVVFLFLQPRREEVMRDIAQLAEEARNAAHAYFEIQIPS